MPASRHYTFRDTWVVPASAARARAVLVDLEHYGSWWPQVVAVAKVGPDDARVLCRSALPYTLDLHLHAVGLVRLLEHGADVEAAVARGDLELETHGEILESLV
ncbi:MAG: hypothetical protein Q8Q44_27460, partial [Nocardioides sp.]|nr:hypothetical protein [Nocardioides sp.]